MAGWQPQRVPLAQILYFGEGSDDGDNALINRNAMSAAAALN